MNRSILNKRKLGATIIFFFNYKLHLYFVREKYRNFLFEKGNYIFRF